MIDFIFFSKEQIKYENVLQTARIVFNDKKEIIYDIYDGYPAIEYGKFPNNNLIHINNDKYRSIDKLPNESFYKNIGINDPYYIYFETHKYCYALKLAEKLKEYYVDLTIFVEDDNWIGSFDDFKYFCSNKIECCNNKN